ncbi:hypothetical protein GOODEAATRI_023832 [Goodea atripinnis]|uniref:ADGRF3/5-like N-terminal domain-containing protein n=1 Tax=Goodea atripinnis TaxID=208336 RepID=A0ABV0MUL4_9TELE
MCTQDTSLFAHQTTWRVRMALPKMLRFAVIFFVVCYTLDKPGFRQSLSVLFEEMTAIKSPSIHVREKRETPTDFTDYDLKVVISLSDLAVLQSILNNLSFPILINNTTEISNIHATTVCSPNKTRYQCRCEENFVWSYKNCITYGVCDVIIGDTCGCINDLPADGQFCQGNSSQTVTTLTTPTSTPDKGMASTLWIMYLCFFLCSYCPTLAFTHAVPHVFKGPPPRILTDVPLRG